MRTSPENSLLARYNPDVTAEAGCDEAGRGCLAGSVFAAAVIFPQNYTNPPLNDSKNGNRFKPYADIPFRTVVKGDGKYLSIAAASILAKTCRDDYMHSLHTEYPAYGWDHNAGYPTAAHREAIRRYGPTPYHRRTFNLTGDDRQLTFNFGETATHNDKEQPSTER